MKRDRRMMKEDREEDVNKAIDGQTRQTNEMASYVINRLYKPWSSDGQSHAYHRRYRCRPVASGGARGLNGSLRCHCVVIILCVYFI